MRSAREKPEARRGDGPVCAGVGRSHRVPRAGADTYGATEVFGAWGDVNSATIRKAKPEVLSVLSRMGVRIFYFGDLTAKGEPRHLNPRGPRLDLRASKQYL